MNIETNEKMETYVDAVGFEKGGMEGQIKGGLEG